MKILIATGLYPPESGGPATYSALIERELPKRGIEVRVLPFRVVRHLPKLVRHVAYLWRCYGLAQDADVVLALDTVSVGLPALLASCFANKRFIVRVPGDYAWEQARQRFGVTDELEVFQAKRYSWRIELLRRVQLYVVRGAREVIVPSEYMRGIVSRWGARHIATIYSSVSMPRVAEVNRPSGFFIVTIARPVPWKGLEGLGRVVAREKDWHLKIVNDLPYEEAMGWVKSADVFALNSTYEGLSHALVEAMMLGTPIVATKVGGNPELIEHELSGLLIPAKDDEALYAALKQVCDDRAAARARAEAARAATARFTIETAVDKLEKLLHGSSRVLMLSGDKNALSRESGVFGRLLLQASQVDTLDVFVQGPKLDESLDGHGSVHGFKGSKIRAALAMMRAARHLSFDLVSAQDPFWLGLIAWRIARRRGAKLQLQVHSDIEGQSWTRRLLARFLLRRADGVRVVSEKIKQQVLAMEVSAPIQVLPVYVELNRFVGIAKKDHSGKNILWIGRFEDEKDPLLAIDVLKEIITSIPDATLTMIGTGSMQQRVSACAADFPVRLPGFQDALVYLGNADVVLSTSRFESWGASIVEALAAGVAVVAPDVGVAREAGATVVPRGELAQAVVRVLREKQKGELKLELLDEKDWARAWREGVTGILKA